MKYDFENDRDFADRRKSPWREPFTWLAIFFGILIGIVLAVLYIAAMTVGGE